MTGGAKKIGDYLVEGDLCRPADVEAALKLQANLEREGRYESFGRLLVEQGKLSESQLAAGLHRQRLEVLAGAELFQGLDAEQVLRIAELVREETLPRDTTVFRQGEAGDTFWLIIAGRVRVFRSSEEGVETELAVLGPGDGFGEMALLTGESRSASVVTLESSRFLVVPKNGFDRLVDATPHLSVAFAKILSTRLSQGNLSLNRASATEQAYQRFVSEYQTGPQPELVGECRLMIRLREAVVAAAENGAPVLVTGPRGSETRAASWHMHRQKPGAGQPFLVFDAKNLAPGQAESDRSAGGEVQSAFHQESALFGQRRGTLAIARHDRLGLLQVANHGTVVIENIEYLAEGLQDKVAEFLRTGTFLPLGGVEPVRASVRVVACSTADLKQLAGRGRFSADLLARFGHEITIPPLRRRKKDLGRILDYLVRVYSRREGKDIHEIERETYEEIMAYDWPGNMEELEVVVRRAVNLARGMRLTPADIFLGHAPVAGRFTVNLLKQASLHRLFTSRVYPGLPQAMAGVFFLIIMGLGFFGSQAAGENVSQVLTWGIWEPAVVFGALLIGRLWCAVCPIGAASSLCSSRLGRQLPVPRVIRRYGLYIGGGGLAVIFLGEVAAHMIASPRATAILLVAIITPALVVALLYQRRTWCRYLCPLGRLLGVLSTCSPFELRANQAICNHDCRNHACYLGGGFAPGCPMFEGPFSLHSNTDCILCGNCIKNCENLSPRFNLRLPAYELWAGGRPDPVVVFLVPVLTATQLFRGLADIGLFPVVKNAAGHWLLLAAFLGMFYLAVRSFLELSDRMFGPRANGRKPAADGLAAVSLLPLTAAFELAYHLRNFLGLAGQLLPVLGGQLGYDWQHLGGEAAPAVIAFWQTVLILIGAGMARVLARKLAGPDAPNLRRWPLLVPAGVYLFLILAAL